MPTQPDVISAKRLALWLSWPSILGEFPPGPLLGNKTDQPPALPWPEADRHLTGLRQPFSDAVRACIAGHEAIAVSVSGGLDSLAVLIEVARIADEDGRRVVATIAEMTDDAGVSNVPIVRDLIAAADLRNVELYVSAQGDTPNGKPIWREDGPQLDALPLANRRLAEVASDHDATIMLGGNGADELLGAVKYLFGSYITAADWRTFRSYWSDSIGVYRPAYRAESLAIASRSLPRKWRTFLYFAHEWPELSNQRVPNIVGIEHHAYVSDWSARRVSEIMDIHTRHHSSWATMAAWDAVFPLHILPGGGPIPLRHPFLTPAFVAAAQRLPLARRYDPQFPHAYWRQKAQVLALIPKSVWSALPTAKQTFRNELSSRYLDSKLDASTLIASSVVGGVAWECADDTLLVNRVNKLELWTREAIARGYSVTRD